MSESLLRKGNTHCVLVSWPNAFGAVKNKEKENSGLEKAGTETRWIFTGKEFDSVLFCRYTFKGFMQYICTQVESVAFSYAFILTDRSTSRRSSFHSVWYLQNIVAACYYPFWVWVNFSTGDSGIFESESTALSVSVFCLQHALCVQDGWNILFTFPVCASHSHSQWNGQSHFSLWHLCVCVCVCSYADMGSHTARCPRYLVGPTIAPFLTVLHELPFIGVGLARVKKLGSLRLAGV